MSQSQGPVRKRLTRRESKQRTRELLLEAAAAVFGREGFEGASVEEVAEEAGFSKGAVYSNFGGKDDLFLALLDRRIGGGVGPRWEEVFEEGKPLAERLERADGLLSSGSEDERPWTMLELEFFLYAMREESARAKLAERYEDIRGAITHTLQRHFEEMGTDPPMPEEHLSWALLAMATGMEIQGRVASGSAPEELWKNVLARLLSSGSNNG